MYSRYIYTHKVLIPLSTQEKQTKLVIHIYLLVINIYEYTPPGISKLQIVITFLFFLSVKIKIKEK